MFSIFRSKREKTSNTINWSLLSVDFHSHLIPNVDDGSSSIEETIAILTFLKSIGYQKIITSPHIMEEGFRNTKSGLEEHFSHLIADERIRELNLDLGIIAEYYLDEGFEKLLIKDELLNFQNRYILVETSMHYEFPFVKEYIFELIKNGYQPILAHPERYSYIYNEKNSLEIYEEYKSMGVYFQLNLFSLIGLYGEKIKKMSEMLIDNGCYDFVSTDIHKASQINLFEKLNSSLFLNRLIASGNLKNKSLLD